MADKPANPNDDKARPASNADKQKQHPKPARTPNELVGLLKDHGVKFEKCSEDEAIEYLRHTNNYFRAASYRKLYPIREFGPDKGKYGNLDFAALVALSSIDRELRCAFREIAIDIEHFARVELVEKCVEHGEDGYKIVEDYFARLRKNGNGRAIQSIEDRSATGDKPDPYSGDIIAHYLDDLGGLSVWALLEVVEFGRFADFLLFCARRWKDQEMLEQHYVLRSVKSIRNACCHNNCIVHAFSKSAESASYTVREPLASSLKENGLKNTKSRKAKLHNLRIAQIAAALYAANRYCERDSTRARHIELMDRLRSTTDAARPLFPNDGSLGAYFDFIFKMVDIWLPPRA